MHPFEVHACVRHLKCTAHMPRRQLIPDDGMHVYYVLRCCKRRHGRTGHPAALACFFVIYVFYRKHTHTRVFSVLEPKHTRSSRAVFIKDSASLYGRLILSDSLITDAIVCRTHARMTKFAPVLYHHSHVVTTKQSAHAHTQQTQHSHHQHITCITHASRRSGHRVIKAHTCAHLSIMRTRAGVHGPHGPIPTQSVRCEVHELPTERERESEPTNSHTERSLSRSAVRWQW